MDPRSKRMDYQSKRNFGQEFSSVEKFLSVENYFISREEKSSSSGRNFGQEFSSVEKFPSVENFFYRKRRKEQ